jgi:hypothetical protein
MCFPVRLLRAIEAPRSPTPSESAPSTESGRHDDQADAAASDGGCRANSRIRPSGLRHFWAWL